MKKQINCYLLTKPLPTGWGEHISGKYKNNLTVHGMIWFYDGDSLEPTFIEDCKNNGLVFYRKEIKKYTGKDLTEYPYHFLTVQSDMDIYDEESFLDLSSMCDGSDKFRCTNHVTQDRKIILDYKATKNLDIKIVPFTNKNSIVIISKRLKDLLDEQDLTGYKVIPCLDSQVEYYDKQLKFDHVDEELNTTEKYFQLVITGTPKTPGYYGQGEILSQCPVCGNVNFFTSSRELTFNLTDLSHSDFLINNTYSFEDGTTFSSVFFERIIISSKVLKLLLDYKIKGLGSYSVDPPIKNGVIELRDL